nr:multicopper oxidase domain-containing protein [Micromonospora deserti]
MALPAAGMAGYVWSTAYRSNVGQVSFDRPLAIPPLARGVRDAHGRLRVDLRLQTGQTELLPGKRADTWGVNGSYLGPTVRVSRGDTLAPVVRNELPEATTLHWHGMELPAEFDGGPHRMIQPGAVWQPAWRVDQPAATLWFHPHPHGRAKEHVYRGVAGLLYVDDGAAEGLLPSEYGVDDIPLIVQDKDFTPEGRLDHANIAFGGFAVTGLLGSEILVNGVWGPVLDVRTERVRLRVLNASNARIYDLVLGGGRDFHVVAGDNGLLPAPVRVDHLRLSPGERAELLVELRPGERVRLRSRPPELGANLSTAWPAAPTSSTSWSCAPRRTCARLRRCRRPCRRRPDYRSRPPAGPSAFSASATSSSTRRPWTPPGSTPWCRSAAPRSGGCGTTSGCRITSTSTTLRSRCWRWPVGGPSQRGGAARTPSTSRRAPRSGCSSSSERTRRRPGRSCSTAICWHTRTPA